MSTYEADILIVGGGTAGLTLAARLSEDPNLDVLLLEAGDHDPKDPRVTTPALWAGLIGSDADWGFTTVPQPHLQNKRLPMVHGRLLGGSSAINGMALIANSEGNLNTWASLGNPDWKWENIKPYYRKTFTLTLPSEEKQKEFGLEYVNTELSGADGPLKVSFPDRFEDHIPGVWVQTFKNLGYAVNGDPYDGKSFGGYLNSVTIDPDSKTRSFSFTAYYEPAKHRSNLRVIEGATVDKVLFDTSDPSSGEPRATGIQFKIKNEIHTARCRREIVLSAGAMNSPKILELSGIGSPDILSAHSIPLLVANPNVGENLQDHVLTGLTFEVRDEVSTKDDLMRQLPAAVEAATAQYRESQSGPFSIGGNEISALMPTPGLDTESSNKTDTTSGEPSARTALETLLEAHTPSNPTPFDVAFAAYLRRTLLSPTSPSAGLLLFPTQADFAHDGASSGILAAARPENFVTIAVSLLQPASRGSTHVASADPEVPPALDPKYLSAEVDVEVLARQLRFVEQVAGTEPFKGLLKEGGKRTRGAERDLREEPLERVRQFVRETARSNWHPCGSCAMMSRELGGVVDSRLRVYGVKGLRIADASVIPLEPRGNPMSSVYVVAERLADLMKEDLGSSS